MSLIQRGTQAVAGSKQRLYELSRANIPSPSLANLFGAERVARHGMIKQLVALNVGLYGFYLFSNGPLGLIYKNYFTIDSNSSILAVPLSNFGHTSIFSLLFNTGVLWTIGNSHAMKYGCMKFCTVFGAGCLGATLLATSQVWSKGGDQLAGCIGGTSALITYNVFKNPQWFNIFRSLPSAYFLLASLTFLGTYNQDMGICGGIAGGFIATVL